MRGATHARWTAVAVAVTLAATGCGGGGNRRVGGRGGAAAEGVDAFTAELTGLGAGVSVAACDLADRTARDALLAGVPADRPVRAVVHAAGVLDDGMAES
ncbi:KR domain-containing protein, partial [Streptomyces albidoflavus]|uniref:KR domain-containing protein n=1 Tax=Streptomyces albidoflavus TaxID=1886 RepID=UPI00211C6C97